MKEKKGRKREELPEEFSSYEEAGQFWDRHDSTDYLDQMTPVELDAELKKRHFEIEIDGDVHKALWKRAEFEHIPASKLANELLRKELAAG